MQEPLEAYTEVQYLSSILCRNWWVMKDVLILHRLCAGESLTAEGRDCMAAARWKGRAVAVKVMLASAGDHAGELESFRQEVQVLSGLAHERIICLLGACLAPPHICIVEELANAGSLFNHLHGARPGYPPHHGMPYAQVKLAPSLNTYVIYHAKTPYATPCMASCHATGHTMVRPYAHAPP